MTGRARSGPIERTVEAQKRRFGSRDLAGWERAASGVAGGALLVRGLGRGSIGGALMAAAGGWLLARGVRGRGRRLRTPDAAGGRSTRGTVSASRTVTVRKPPEELSDLWLDPEGFSQVVGDLVEVSGAGDGRLVWTVRGPLGGDLSWESRIVEEHPGELLRWETLDGAPVPHEGSVRFRPAPADLGTEVTLSVRLDPPGGALGVAALSRVDAAVTALVARALRRFRSLAETGEIPTLDRNPSGRGRGDLL